MYRWYFMFRLAELRKRHIIGAKVRMFCVRHERCPIAMANGGDQDPETGNAVVELETAYFVSHPLPLVNGSQSTNTTNNNHSGLTSANASDVSESSYEQSILMGLPHVLVHSMDGLSPMIPPVQSGMMREEFHTVHSLLTLRQLCRRHALTAQ